MTTLAKLRMNPTAAGRHLVRGTVPVPPSFSGPVHLRDSRGVAIPTQVEVGALYPDGKPSSIEVLALADTGGGDFALVAGAGPDAAWGASFSEAAAPFVIDHKGTKSYSSSATYTQVRDGDVMGTWEGRGRIGPLGFVRYATFLSGEDMILCELLIHNGGCDPVQGDVYFESIGLDLPKGYVVSHLWPEPWATEDGYLVKPAPYCHVMLQKQPRVFRYAIHRPEQAARARAFLEMQGLAVAIPGDGLWSWQSVPAYFPGGARMPSLHGVTGGWDAYPYGITRDGIWNALANGGALPNVNGGNIGAAGPFHPYSGSYGGATGGDGIWQYDGLAILNTGRVDKLHEVLAVERCWTDRHRVALYGSDGAIKRTETLTGDWKVAAYPGMMWGGKAGQLNYGAASQWMRDEVAAMGKLPPYENYLRGFEAIDFQHLIRAVSASLVSAWIVNDPMSKHLVALNAEWARAWAYEIGNGELAAAAAKSQQYPGKGGFGGRECGWAADVIAAAYKLSRDPRRADRWGKWFSTFIEHCERAKLPSGCLLAHEWGKPTDGFGDDATAQSFENGIFIGGLRAVWSATGDARIPPILLDAARGHGIKADGTRVFHWLPGWGGPQTRIAVRSKDPSKAAYSTAKASPVPLESDNWQTFSLLAYGLEIAPGDPLILAAVKDALGSDPLGSMLSKPQFQLDNRAPLMAHFQGGAVQVPPPVDPPPPTRPPPTEPPPPRTDPTRERLSRLMRWRLALARMIAGRGV